MVYDTFLIMNIAAPGSCDFYRARLVGADYEDDISLSNFNFEVGLQTHLDRGWPSIGALQLETVANWYESVRPNPTQVPQNPMERVLFALLHMAKIDLSPMTVIWLFYAFEGLLQTRVGENFSTIVARLCLLLEANKEQEGIVRKQMRSLYDIRNAVVHGGFEVIHPMHDEQLDRRVDDAYGKLMKPTDWGQAFLLASIQKTIEKGWLFPRFSEVLVGEPIDSDPHSAL